MGVQEELVWGLSFGVYRLVFVVWGLVFGVWGLLFGVGQHFELIELVKQIHQKRNVPFRRHC